MGWTSWTASSPSDVTDGSGRAEPVPRWADAWLAWSALLLVCLLVLPSASVAQIASEEDVTSGPLSANDAYDLVLEDDGDGTCTLTVHMNLQMFFYKGPGGSWSAAERQSFKRGYENLIEQVWENQHLIVPSSGGGDCPCRGGTNVMIDLESRIGGIWVEDHWELEITKISAAREQSYVNSFTGNVILDQKDLLPTAGMTLRAAAHEFGHQLGLEDEYQLAGGDTPGIARFVADRGSIMNRGSDVRPRHYTIFSDWMSEEVADGNCGYGVSLPSGGVMTGTTAHLDGP